MTIAVRLRNVTAAELSKLGTLPTAIVAAAGTVLAAGGIAAALAANPATQRSSAVAVTAQTIPYVQVGLILLGILPVAHEYAGGQLRTTLMAVPDRGLLVAAKTIAVTIAAALTGTVTVAVGRAVAALTRHTAGVRRGEAGVLLDAAGYLVLSALLAHAVALLVRNLTAALVAMLGLVLIVSPLLASVSEGARWLPDRAAAQLYDPTDTVLTAGTGTLVAVAWTTVIAGIATVQFIHRDA